jgi:tetratricopeptide (TPR) repeat protein
MQSNKDISPADFDLIERYLEGNLDDDEVSIVENRLKTDPLFKQHFDEHQLLIEAIEQQSLKDKLSEFHAEVEQRPGPFEVKKQRKQFAFVRNFAIAASVIVLLGLSGYLIFFNKPQNLKLYAKYFKPDPGLATTMSGSAQFEFYDAMVNYKRGDYDKAISKWETLLSKTNENDTLNYFLGVAYLAKNETGKALDYLMKTTTDTISVFKEDAFYYAGLAYLKTGQMDKAIRFFKQSETDKSKSILKELE